MTILVGCSGWSYNDWVGGFYPIELANKKGAWFDYYARYFRTVEINSTFYRPPGEFQVNAWIKNGKDKKGFEYSLKVPGAVQRKSGKRSQLLDPDTKQPVDVIFITKVLELRLPEKEAVKVGVRQYLPAKSRPARASKIGTSRHSSAASQPARISEMRPCILAAINKKLEGSEGNDMRQAIVCEALAAGKTRDEVIALFEGQDDFDPTITAYYADYIARRGYWPWKCETIQEKCSTLVTCGGCPLREEMSDEDPEIPVEPVMVR